MPTTSESRLIHAPQRDVWALLSDVTQARRWNKFWSAIEFVTTQTHGIGTRFVATTEADDRFVFEICEWDAPQRIAFCPIREEGERYSITLESHTFMLREISEDQCEMTIAAEASVSGFRGRIIGLFFWAGHQKEGLNAALDAVQSVFEPELFADDAEPETQEAFQE